MPSEISINMTRPRRPSDLPDFKSPPVSEVALSIQFNPLPKLGSIHSGLLWQTFREEFPNVLEQVALQPAFETFVDPGSQAAPIPTLQLLSAWPMPRYWFISADETELLQIQQDRIIYNWRQMKPENVYPRYEHLREKFESATKKIQAFLIEGKLGEIKPNQCEVTYVNFILPEAGVDPRRQLERITPLWSGQYSGDMKLTIEDLNLSWRYVLHDQEKKPDARLFVTILGAIRNSDKKLGIQLQLVTRGRPKGETVEAAFQWLDRGRGEIVKNFALITKPEMHKIWGKINAAS